MSDPSPPPALDAPAPGTAREPAVGTWRAGRAERLLAWSRLALASLALGAVWLDPAEPARYANVAYSILAVYLLFAALLVVLLEIGLTPLPRFQLASHVLDLVVAIGINFLTGSGSPFFVLFIYLLVATTIRWQWRGTAWMASITLLAYAALALVAPDGIGDPDFELNRFLIRISYLAVVAVLLASLGSYQERLTADLARLAAGPGSAALGNGGLGPEGLAQAASILSAPRVVLAWREAEEPRQRLQWWSATENRIEQLAPREIQPLVHPRLEHAAFFCPNLDRAHPDIVLDLDGSTARARLPPLDPAFREALAARSVLSVPLAGSSVEGRLFALDKSPLTADDLVLARILGRQVAALLDQSVQLEQQRHSAAAAERLRVARELHDGVSQALTGTVLQLGAVRSQLSDDVDGAGRRLAEIQDLLVEEQRELRLLIQELRPVAPAATEAARLAGRLEELRERVSSLWGVEAALTVAGEVPRAYRGDVYRLIQEALVNSARHAGCSRVEVRIEVGEDAVAISASDDGRGFPFHGSRNLDELIASQLGPRSLMERVSSMAGSLVVHSSESGSAVEIRLPSPDAETR